MSGPLLPFLRVKAPHSREAVEDPAARDTALAEAFWGLADLLSAEPTPEVFNGLAHAARDMTGADAAWLLAMNQGRLTVLGRSVGPDTHLEAFLAQPDVRAIPLAYHDQPVGYLALWAASAPATSNFELAFERALAAALGARQELTESRWLSQTDPLTGLANRRRLEEWLPSMMALERRGGRPLSLLMLDLDHFKQVNDEAGHEAGDAFLVSFARMLLQSLRASDLPVRYGGEEFLVLLPDTDAQNALRVAEKIRTACERLEVSDSEGPPRQVTVSIGQATLEESETPQGLIDRADQALYQAKGLGRNRTVPAGESTK